MKTTTEMSEDIYVGITFGLMGMGQFRDTVQTSRLDYDE